MGCPSLSISSSKTVCFPAAQPVSQIGSHLSIYLVSPPSTEYRTRQGQGPSSTVVCAFSSPDNTVFESQKSIIIALVSSPLYSPFGRLYVSKGFLGSTGPAIEFCMSLPSGVGLAAFAFDIGCPEFVVAGLFASAPPFLTVNFTI